MWRVFGFHFPTKPGQYLQDGILHGVVCNRAEGTKLLLGGLGGLGGVGVEWVGFFGVQEGGGARSFGD